MVVYLPASWLCAVIATLRFEEFLTVVPTARIMLKDDLLPATTISNVAAATTVGRTRDKFLGLLLPPWQRSLLLPMEEEVVASKEEDGNTSDDDDSSVELVVGNEHPTTTTTMEEGNEHPNDDDNDVNNTSEEQQQIIITDTSNNDETTTKNNNEQQSSSSLTPQIITSNGSGAHVESTENGDDGVNASLSMGGEEEVQEDDDTSEMVVNEQQRHIIIPHEEEGEEGNVDYRSTGEIDSSPLSINDGIGDGDDDGDSIMIQSEDHKDDVIIAQVEDIIFDQAKEVAINNNNALLQENNSEPNKCQEEGEGGGIDNGNDCSTLGSSSSDGKNEIMKMSSNNNEQIMADDEHHHNVQQEHDELETITLPPPVESTGTIIIISALSAGDNEDLAALTTADDYDGNKSRRTSSLSQLEHDHPPEKDDEEEEDAPHAQFNNNVMPPTKEIHDTELLLLPSHPAAAASSSSFITTILEHPKRTTTYYYHHATTIIASIPYLSTILCIIYSLAVHSFLSFFHERSFLCTKHWKPIILRIVISFLIWGVVMVSLNCCNMPLLSTTSAAADDAVVQVIVAIGSIIISTKLILETRRIEVDGPPPPLPLLPSSLSSSSSSSNSNVVDVSSSLEGKVIFITGANGGIGLETARQLYHRGATVLLGCRSKERALDAMRDIVESSTSSSSTTSSPPSSSSSSSSSLLSRKQQTVKTVATTTRLHYIPLDLTCTSSIHNAVTSFHQLNLPYLHILINNAGVMRNKREETTTTTTTGGGLLDNNVGDGDVGGLEMTMAANHLGHFLLTNLLLPKLRETSLKEGYSSRVITVSSSLYCRARRRSSINGKKWEPGLDVDDLQCQQKPYSLFEQYAQSKLANIMFALELGRRERDRLIEPSMPAEAEAEARPPPIMVPEQQIVSTPPKKKNKKKLRPKLTPVEDPATEDEVDNDVVGLGFSDIVASPGKKNRMRPKLASDEEEKKDDDDDNGNYEVDLGFNEIVASSSPVKRDKMKKKKKKMRPKLTPTSMNSNCVDERRNDDDNGLFGFDDIVPSTTSVMTKKKSRPKLTPVSCRDDDDDEEADQSFAITTGKKSRRKLTPISPSKVTDDDEDEVGLGFNDIVMMSFPSFKKKEQPRLTPTVASLVDKEHENEDQIMQQCKLPIDNDDKNETVAGSKNHTENKAFHPVKSYCLHPGLVRTNVVRDMPWYLRYPNWIFSIFMAALQKTPQSGAYTSVFCAIMDTTKIMDDNSDECCYFVNSALQKLDELALDKNDAKKLWEMSSNLVSI